MSDELEKLKTLYEEWARGDYSRSDIFDPDMDVEGFGMGDPIEARDYEGFVDAMRDWLSAWERPLTIEADEFITAGDRILALVRWRGRGKGRKPAPNVMLSRPSAQVEALARRIPA